MDTAIEQPRVQSPGADDPRGAARPWRGTDAAPAGPGSARGRAGGARRSPASAGAPTPLVTFERYDDFRVPGRPYTTDDYLRRWSVWAHSPLEPEALRTRAFADGSLRLQARPFTVSADDVLDHIKYLAISARRFPIPAHGSITIAADVQAVTPGAVAGRVLPTTGRALLEGQQAAATLHLFNLDETGQLYDWIVSEHKAFALYERLVSPGVGLDKAYTQIVAEFDITPGAHRYALRYTRVPGGPDEIAYVLDGDVKASVSNSGIPLDRQDPARYASVTYRARGAGELVRDQMTHFTIGHGLFSLLDEFPFNQFPDQRVHIPRAERLFGQGVKATFGNFTVVTVAYP